MNGRAGTPERTGCHEALGFGALYLLEAMALGVPVVSTAVMGTRDIVGPRHGALVADDKEEDFAAKAVRLPRDRGLRARLAAEGREYARTWSATALALRLEAFYRSVLDQAREPRLTSPKPA